MTSKIVNEGGLDLLRPGRRYAAYIMMVLLVAAVLLVIGYLLVARHRPGTEGALWAGIGASVLGSLAGTVPLLMVWGRRPVDAMSGILGSFAVRLSTALILGAVLALASGFDPVTLLLSLAVSHAALVGADVWLTRSVVAKTELET